MRVGVYTVVAVASLAVLIKLLNPLLDRRVVPATSELWEKEEKEQQEFDPTRTDIFGYDKIGFVKPQVKELELDLGITFFFSQSFPKWVIHLLHTHWTDTGSRYGDNKDKYESKPIDILDARQRSDELSMATNGFTLLTLPQPTRTQNWRQAEDVAHFQQEILPLLHNLFPNATRIVFTNNVVRGGSSLGDQPAAVNGPHLDYSQDDAAHIQFHTEYLVNEAVKEHLALMGKWNTDEDEMKILLGIWKPILRKNVVYDHPLAILDASVFHPEQERPHKIHFDMGFFKFHHPQLGIYVPPRPTMVLLSLPNRYRSLGVYPVQQEQALCQPPQFFSESQSAQRWHVRSPRVCERQWDKAVMIVPLLGRVFIIYCTVFPPPRER